MERLEASSNPCICLGAGSTALCRHSCGTLSSCQAVGSYPGRALERDAMVVDPLARERSVPRNCPLLAVKRLDRRTSRDWKCDEESIAPRRLCGAHLSRLECSSGSSMSTRPNSAELQVVRYHHAPGIIQIRLARRRCSTRQPGKQCCRSGRYPDTSQGPQAPRCRWSTHFDRTSPPRRVWLLPMRPSVPFNNAPVPVTWLVHRLPPRFETRQTNPG